MIRLTDVSRVYTVGGQELRALDHINLTIQTGEYVSIMGPSGSGKSTLLNMLGCLDRPSSGTYELDGQQVGNLSESELAKVRRYRIGFVFQSFHLIKRLPALENIALPLILDGVPHDQARDRARAALDSVGLLKREHHRPNQMSGGEQQRIAIARAIIMDPSHLLADEPTGNLDTKSGTGIVDLLEDLNKRGKTLIVVTHDPEMGKRAKRAVRMVDGRFASDSAQGGA
ncbi:MAG: ABC transporter ATP-binding protein [Acidobacteria bacterium]|nr:ABC transporter ATP-binding protein [Acidobacteriota bacterium]MCB9396587.1 ABC transporter ATP-binding protein [Acidobacteriota bacterium]